jgi:hypothetical protein
MPGAALLREIETTTTLQNGVTYVPFSVDVFELPGALPSHAEAWCHAQLRELAKGQVVGDLTILTASGDVVATADGLPPEADHPRCRSRARPRRPAAFPPPLSGGTSEERSPAPVVHDEVLEAEHVDRLPAAALRRLSRLSGGGVRRRCRA